MARRGLRRALSELGRAPRAGESANSPHAHGSRAQGVRASVGGSTAGDVRAGGRKGVGPDVTLAAQTNVVSTRPPSAHRARNVSPARRSSFRRDALGNADPRRWPVPSVVRRTRGLDFREVRPGPRHQPPDELTQRRAKGRERVLNAGRHFGVHRPCDQAVTLQPAKRHGEHALADAIHLLSQLVEPQRSRIAEHVNDVDGPGVAHAREDVACVTIRRRILELRRPLPSRFAHWLLRGFRGTFACPLFIPFGLPLVTYSNQSYTKTPKGVFTMYADTLSPTLSIGLLIARLVGFVMAAHGTQKLFGWFGGYGLNKTGEFFAHLGFRPGRALAAAASLAEIASGLLVALGFLGPIGPA